MSKPICHMRGRQHLRRWLQHKPPHDQRQHCPKLHIRQPPPKAAPNAQPKRESRSRRGVELHALATHLLAIRTRGGGRGNQPPLGLKLPDILRVPDSHAPLRLGVAARLAARGVVDRQRRRQQAGADAAQDDDGALGDRAAQHHRVLHGISCDAPDGSGVADNFFQGSVEVRNVRVVDFVVGGQASLC